MYISNSTIARPNHYTDGKSKHRWTSITLVRLNVYIYRSNCKQATLSQFFNFLQFNFGFHNECFPNFI